MIALLFKDKGPVFASPLQAENYSFVSPLCSSFVLCSLCSCNADRMCHSWNRPTRLRPQRTRGNLNPIGAGSRTGSLAHLARTLVAPPCCRVVPWLPLPAVGLSLGSPSLLSGCALVAPPCCPVVPWLSIPAVGLCLGCPSLLSGCPLVVHPHDGCLLNLDPPHKRAR